MICDIPDQENNLAFVTSAAIGAPFSCFAEERDAASLSQQGAALGPWLTALRPHHPRHRTLPPLSPPLAGSAGVMPGMTRCTDWKGANTMTKQNPHSRITDRILAELEQGTRPCRARRSLPAPIDPNRERERGGIAADNRGRPEQGRPVHLNRTTHPDVLAAPFGRGWCCPIICLM